MKPATVRRIHAIISSALNYAVSWGWIEKNPAAFAHPPALGRRRARPPAPVKVAALLNAAFADDVEFGVFLAGGDDRRASRRADRAALVVARRRARRARDREELRRP